MIDSTATPNPTAVTSDDFSTFREMTEEDQKASHPVPDLTSTDLSPEIVKDHLMEAMYYVRGHINDYVSRPGNDFVRNGTWFDSVTLMKFIVLMGSGSSICELSKFFGIDQFDKPPHNSTFCMARQKLLPSAFAALFRHFTDSFQGLHTFKGYRLIGVDGSTINIPLNLKEEETLHQNQKDQKCFSQCYFNGAYDLLNAIYVDAIISTLSKTDERSALLEMAERKTSYPTIFVGDRGYGGWKVFARLKELNHKFVIREKDTDSQGIFRCLDLSDEPEFDIIKTIILTNKQTKETLSKPELYRPVMSNQDFPYLDKDHHYYALELRYVRKKVAPGKYICIITNLLDQKEFTADDLQYAYYLRWGQEGSYRIFKYTIGVLQFHARKYINVQQELYAKMVLFNACQLIAGCVDMHEGSSNSRVLTKQEYLQANHTQEEQEESSNLHSAYQNSSKAIRYKPNISAAVTNIKEYLNGKGTGDRVIQRIKRYLVPIRPGRSYCRNIKPQSATTLLYRAA